MKTHVMALLVGAAMAWYVQGVRHGLDIAETEQAQSRALIAAYEQRDSRVQAITRERDRIQGEFDDFKNSERDRDTDVSAGVTRVYVRASCPAVPATETDTGRVESGTAELDPAYRRTLSDLRRGVEEQRRLLNLCRAELLAE